MDRQTSALRQFCSELTSGLSVAEERFLRLAAWCAARTETDNKARSDLASVMESRRGPTGARVRLYVELVRAAGGEAVLFGTFSGVRRNTVVEVRSGGRAWFVDPLVGCICHLGGRLASYAEMHADPESAEAGMELLQFDSADDEAERSERLKKLNNWYRANHLRTTSSFGPLDGETPLVFQLSFDMTRFWYFPFFSSHADKPGFIECGRYLGVSVPNFFGMRDKNPVHQWNFENAEPGEDYEITYTLGTVPKVSLSGAMRRGLTLCARSANAEIVLGATLAPASISRNDANEIDWTIRFRARDEAPVIVVEADARNRGESLPIHALGLKRLAGPLPIATGGKPLNVDHEILARDGTLSTKPPRPIDRDANRVFNYLTRSSTIHTRLASNNFHPWPQRPYNFSWLAEAMAAVYAHRVTGEIRFADWVIENFRKMLAFRDKITGAKDVVRGRVMEGWGGTVPLHREGGVTRWVNEVCTAGCMLTPVLVLIRDLQQDPRLARRYADAIDELLPVCREVLDDYEDEIEIDPATNGAYLVMPYDGVPEPTAHAAPYAAATAAFHACTGDPRYLRRAEQFANFFRASMTEHADGLLSWPYRPEPARMQGEGAYYFKARTALIFPIIANAIDLVFTDEFLTRLARSVVSYVLPDDGQVYVYISPNNRKVLDREQLIWFAQRELGGFLRQIVAYYPLTLFDDRLGVRIDDLVAKWDILFPQGYFSLGIGIESYAVRLDPLRALKPGRPSTSHRLGDPVAPRPAS